MTLDLDVICILGVPIAGIAAMVAASARQFFLGDRELVGLAGADHELAPAPLARSRRRSSSRKCPCLQSIDDKLFETIERLADWSADVAGALNEGWFVTHCAAAPSCP